MLDAMSGPLRTRRRSEGSIWNRAFGGLFRWVDPLFTTPLFGMGIGAGAPGVARILNLPALIYGESDLQRNVNELGLLTGSAMLALRFGTGDMDPLDRLPARSARKSLWHYRSQASPSSHSFWVRSRILH